MLFRSVESKLVHINGTGHIMRAVKTSELKVRGGATFDGDVSCDSTTVSGTATFMSSLEAKSIKISGSAKIDGDCNADKFNSTGLFQTGGLLSADTIDVKLSWGASSAREIGGENITIKMGPGLSVTQTIFRHTPHLKTDSIEGNEILLESTTAKVVRGNNVTIGEGCDIRLVEYSGVLKKMGNARIEEERKI